MAYDGSELENQNIWTEDEDDGDWLWNSSGPTEDAGIFSTCKDLMDMNPMARPAQSASIMSYQSSAPPHVHSSQNTSELAGLLDINAQGQKIEDVRAKGTDRAQSWHAGTIRSQDDISREDAQLSIYSMTPPILSPLATGRMTTQCGPREKHAGSANVDEQLPFILSFDASPHEFLRQDHEQLGEDSQCSQFNVISMDVDLDFDECTSDSETLCDFEEVPCGILSGSHHVIALRTTVPVKPLDDSQRSRLDHTADFGNTLDRGNMLSHQEAELEFDPLITGDWETDEEDALLDFDDGEF